LNSDLFNYLTPSKSVSTINGVIQNGSMYVTRITNNTGKDLILNKVEFFGNGNLLTSGSGIDFIDNGVHLTGQSLDITLTIGAFGANTPLTVSYSYEFEETSFIKTFTVEEEPTIPSFPSFPSFSF
jgi:hypothetical protein